MQSLRSKQKLCSAPHQALAATTAYFVPSACLYFALALYGFDFKMALSNSSYYYLGGLDLWKHPVSLVTHLNLPIDYCSDIGSSSMVLLKFVVELIWNTDVACFSHSCCWSYSASFLGQNTDQALRKPFILLPHQNWLAKGGFLTFVVKGVVKEAAKDTHSSVTEVALVTMNYDWRIDISCHSNFVSLFREFSEFQAVAKSVGTWL